MNAYFRMNNNDSINHYIREAEKMMAELPESSGEVLGYKETLFKILNKMGRYRESLSIQQQMLRAMDVNAQTPIDKALFGNGTQLSWAERLSACRRLL